MKQPQLKTHEVFVLALLLTGSGGMAENIARDYMETLDRFGAEGVNVNCDRWLVLTLISYGYDVDRLKPGFSVPPFTGTGPIKVGKEQIRDALRFIPLPDRFCFLARYALAWEVERIARLMLCDIPRVEAAIASALMRIRARIIQVEKRQESNGAAIAQPETC